MDSTLKFFVLLMLVGLGIIFSYLVYRIFSPYFSWVLFWLILVFLFLFLYKWMPLSQKMILDNAKELLEIGHTLHLIKKSERINIHWGICYFFSMSQEQEGAHIFTGNFIFVQLGIWKRYDLHLDKLIDLCFWCYIISAVSWRSCIPALLNAPVLMISCTLIQGAFWLLSIWH